MHSQLARAQDETRGESSKRSSNLNPLLENSYYEESVDDVKYKDYTRRPFPLAMWRRESHIASFDANSHLGQTRNFMSIVAEWVGRGLTRVLTSGALSR